MEGGRGRKEERRGGEVRSREGRGMEGKEGDRGRGYSYISMQEEDYTKCYEESAKIEKLYGHFFDASIINENIDVAYEELMATIRVFSTGKHWIPANWVM